MPDMPDAPNAPDMPDVTDGREQTVTAAAPVGQPLRFRVLDSTIEMAGLPEKPRARLAELLRPFLIAGDDALATPDVAFAVARNESQQVWDIYRDGKMLMGLGGDEMLVRHLEWRIISDGLTSVAGCGVFHAGALARGGATVLLLGESGAGKTTLTLGLIARGWLPLADDAAIVDVQTLGLRVFPRCFHVEHPQQRPEGARPPLELVAVEGHARPLRWAPEGGQITAIITIARDIEQPSSLTPLLQAGAAGALLKGAMSTPLTRSQVVSLVARIAASARYCGHLNNSDLAASLDLIEAACG